MKTTQLTTTPHRAVALMAWANIAVQALLPISLSLSPVVYASVAESKLRTDSLVVYQVQLGDTAISIAKQFGLTLEELKKLNSEAYKDKSLNALQIGDTLLVPDLRLGERKPAHSIAVKMERDTETLIAEAASSLAAGSAGNSLRSAAVSQANQSVEEWLKQYGTARVRLNVNDDFNLVDSEADLLVSLDDTPDLLSFTQLGLRHRDDRTTVNAGIGQRHFDMKDVEMLGYNLFFDHEIEAGHTRVGVGLEYWRDFLKFSANGYIGLTAWKASEALVDYDERAADGLDLRAEAYLPSHPQLGGELKYEQYFGEEVALSDVNNRQQDPYVMSVGINYTPVSLITAGVDYIKEKGRSGDTQFNLAFNYRLGESLDKQLDGAAMAEYRSLAGSRYDLVERNNNIVLEYRKQQLLKLDVVDEFNRWPEATDQQLVVNVASKYPIESIDWEGQEFFAAGGKIAPLSSRTTQGNSLFKVTLPAYKANGINLYSLVAKATDNKGNESNTDSTNIEVFINNTAKPIVTDLKMFGVLEAGQELTATYVWNANGGEPTDKSNFAWGNKGETVAIIESSKGSDIKESNTIPPITLELADIGKVKEVAIQAENGLDIKGEKILSVNSSQTEGEGNYTTEGGPEGEVTGPVSDAAPSISDLKITGYLLVGDALKADYKWNDNGGDQTDKSLFQWGTKDNSASSEKVEGQTELDLTAEHAGKVIEVTVTPKNGIGIEGEPQTANTVGTDDVLSKLGKVLQGELGVTLGKGQNTPVKFAMDQGVPSIGAKGLGFEFYFTKDGLPTGEFVRTVDLHYTWKVEGAPAFVSIDYATPGNGTLSFKFIRNPQDGESGTFKIIGTPRVGSKKPVIEHPVNIKKWYIIDEDNVQINDTINGKTIADLAAITNTWCSQQGSGYRIPERNEVSYSTSWKPGGVPGSLTGEYGPNLKRILGVQTEDSPVADPGTPSVPYGYFHREGGEYKVPWQGNEQLLKNDMEASCIKDM
ncbi:MAG: inverse autotransporter beta domain-containing protein [Plesiomonas sp.]|uniref:inverse autotransporter beta domain-containing protein n=1 Tax=Plesiomonas sp. TaxID=2486279 RepID=UPI003F31BDD4